MITEVEVAGDLLSVLVGGALALSGSIGLRAWDEHTQRRAMRAAIRAEITAILRGAESRQHEQKFQAAISRWQAGEDYRPAVWGPSEVRPDPVFRENLSKIGVLGPHLAPDAVRFYAMVEGARRDLLAWSQGKWWDLTPADRATAAQSGLDIWGEAKALGEALVKRL